MKKELQLNIKETAERLKRSTTFKELEYYVKAGMGIQDLVLIVPKGILHSGSMRTRYGPLLVVTNLNANSAVIRRKPERLHTPDYLTS
jgi:hypothetical protein